MTVLKGQKSCHLTPKMVTVLLNLVTRLSTFGCVFLNVQVFNTFIFQRAPIFFFKNLLFLEASDDLSWVRKVNLWPEWGKGHVCWWQEDVPGPEVWMTADRTFACRFWVTGWGPCVHFPGAQETSWAYSVTLGQRRKEIWDSGWGRLFLLPYLNKGNRAPFGRSDAQDWDVTTPPISIFWGKKRSDFQSINDFGDLEEPPPLLFSFQRFELHKKMKAFTASHKEMNSERRSI